MVTDVSVMANLLYKATTSAFHMQITRRLTSGFVSSIGPSAKSNVPFLARCFIILIASVDWACRSSLTGFSVTSCGSSSQRFTLEDDHGLLP